MDLLLPSCDNSPDQLQQFSESMWTFIISVFTWMQSRFVDITFSIIAGNSCYARQEGSVVRQQFHRQMQFQNPSITRNKHMLLISCVGARGNVSFFVRVTQESKVERVSVACFTVLYRYSSPYRRGYMSTSPRAFLLCLIERWLSCQRVHLAAK